MLALGLTACTDDHVSLGSDLLVSNPGSDGSPDDGKHEAGSSGSSGANAGHGGSGHLDAGIDSGTSQGGSGGTDAHGAACGLRTTPDCPSGQYCAYDESAACGDSNAPGECRTWEFSGCTAEVDPVCGCDGRTYPNRCTASALMVSVRADGPCTTSSGGSGTPCGGPFSCPQGEYCRYGDAAGCGLTGAPGACDRIPSICSRDQRTSPVCGCDAKTYDSECEAAMAGVSVLANVDCATLFDAGLPGGIESGAVCGGFSGDVCPQGQYCNLAAGDGCDEDAGQGRCAPTPFNCPQDYSPVCGCDGANYPSACYAALFGVSVTHPGPCQQP